MTKTKGIQDFDSWQQAIEKFKSENEHKKEEVTVEVISAKRRSLQESGMGMYRMTNKHKRIVSAYDEGFDNGWDAALKIFCEYNPDFFEWIVNIKTK